MKIDSGVPIPVRDRGRYGKTATSMQEGDSVFFKTLKEAEHLRSALNYRGFRTKCRPDILEGISGFRVWKTKPKRGKNEPVSEAHEGTSSTTTHPGGSVVAIQRAVAGATTNSGSGTILLAPRGTRITAKK